MKFKKNLKKILFTASICLFSFTCLWGCSETKKEESSNQKASSANEVEEKSIFAMDTYMTITAYGPNRVQAVDQAIEEIQRLEKLFNAEDKNSEISIVNENGSEILSEDTAFLIEKSIELYDSTDGLFDIGIYPLMREWGFTSEKYKVPDQKTIKKLLKQANLRNLEYDKEKKLLTLNNDIEIDLGGIAKGYTSSRIMEIFEKNDISSGMVSLGGNVQLYKKRENGENWRVGIQNPDKNSEDLLGILELSDKAIITSGAYERFFEKDGKIYHHIIDPRTGFPSNSGLSSVTIVSDDGTLADGLSTSLYIMGKDAAIEYWRKNSDKFDFILCDQAGKLYVSQGIQDAFSSEKFTFQIINKYR